MAILKLCPCCGSCDVKAETCKVIGKSGLFSIEKFRVKCQNCGIGTSGEVDKEIAEMIWNRRYCVECNENY